MLQTCEFNKIRADFIRNSLEAQVGLALDSQILCDREYKKNLDVGHIVTSQK